MCGFIQVLTRDGTVDPRRFEAGMHKIAHRGPDGCNKRTLSLVAPTPKGDVPVGIAMGHHRLSILDLGERASQPFGRSGQWLLFNGEIYNFLELRQNLAPPPGGFETTGDTEVLFEGLRQHGRPFLQQLSGMWAATYLDGATKTLWATRDRFGKKPLFFYKDESQLILASTIGAIHAYLGTDPQLRATDLATYLLTGRMWPHGTGDTHFEGIREVLPGHWLLADLAAWDVETECYYSPPRLQEGAVTLEPMAALEASCLEAVVARLISDRPVGLLLSGGIDSSLLLSALCKAGCQERVHCFIGETGRSDDARYAHECVSQAGIAAEVVDLAYGERAFDEFLTMCRHHEKAFPFMGSTMAMAQMYRVIAERGIPVVLDGSGGDELFGGYWQRQYPAAVRAAVRERNFGWLRQSMLASSMNRKMAARVLRSLVSGGLTDRLGWKEVKKRIAPTYRTLGLHRFVRESVRPDPLGQTLGFTETMLGDISPGGRLGEWLWHNDRNAMMSGVENRSPLLDFRLAPFAAGRYEQMFVGPYNKHQLRLLFDRFHPMPTQWRTQKQGFRWDRKRFFRENKVPILELIRASTLLGEQLSVSAYVDKANRSDAFLLSGVTSRLLGIAGLEAALK